MRTGGIWLTCAAVGIGASVILALLFRFWPRYGSVQAAVEHSDHILAQMETAQAQHEQGAMHGEQPTPSRRGAS